MKRRRKVVSFDLTCGDRDEAKDALVLDSDVRHADVVTELILASETVEETVEVVVPRTKLRTIILLAESSNLHRA